MLDIKVIAPSSKSADSFDLLKRAKLSLEPDGVNLIFRDDIFSDAELPFLAANKDIIDLDLEDAFLRAEYEIIWAARGGYGCSNHLKKLSQIDIFGSKILIGFSDITAFHLYLNQYRKIPSIHGPNVTNFERDKLDFLIFKDILSGNISRYNLEAILNTKEQIMPCEVVGGNLSVLTTLIGTEFTPKFTSKILLLEDVNEKGYQIHRHLMHLKNSGSLEGLSAIIFGEFTNSDEYVNDVIVSFCRSEINIPSYRIKAIGHVENNMPIVFGAESYIKGSALYINSPFNFKHEF